MRIWALPFLQNPRSGSFLFFFLCLVNPWDDAIANSLLVLDPVVSILAMAFFVIAAVPVNQENRKVHNVEIRNGNSPTFGIALDNLAPVLHNIRILASPATSSQDLVAGHAGRKAVGPGLDPVAKVVDMASYAPPAGCQQLAARLGLDKFEVSNLGVIGVVAEVVLFEVGRAEDEESNTNKCKHGCKSDWAKRQRMVGEVAGLLRVDEWNPDQVTKGQHHAETVGSDVHRCEDGGFKHPRVDNVQSLNNGDADDAVCDIAKVTVLLSTERAVENDPAHHARAQLAPLLDVDFADEWNSNAGVQFAANEPIVEQVACVTARSKLAVLHIASLDAEAAHIDKCRKTVCNDDAGGEKLDVVFTDKDPDGKVGALGGSTSSKKSQGESVGVESYPTALAKTSTGVNEVAHTVEAVLETSSCSKDSSLYLLGGENSVQNQVEEVVSSHGSASLPASKTPDAIFRPASLAFKLIERECLGAEKGWRGAA